MIESGELCSGYDARGGHSSELPDEAVTVKPEERVRSFHGPFLCATFSVVGMRANNVRTMCIEYTSRALIRKCWHPLNVH